jgi:hypothetical protein
MSAGKAWQGESERRASALSWRQALSWGVVSLGIALVVIAAISHRWVWAALFLLALPWQIWRAVKDRRNDADVRSGG